ncbi:MAG: MarR family transcriptional regulator [Candidatus Saccharibacteria bacterium]|nr:MarR family transcriptional regulator [Candidatus Saccharibacteria bacterium]
MEVCESLRLRNQICFPLYLCSKEITGRYAPFLKPLDLTYTQYVVMMFLWEHQHTNIRDLGKVLLLDTNTLTPLLQKLEAKGYIVRKKSPKDGREMLISLTERGYALQTEAAKIPELMRACVNLTPEEAEILYKLLYKVLFNLEGGK